MRLEGEDKRKFILLLKAVLYARMHCIKIITSVRVFHQVFQFNYGSFSSYVKRLLAFFNVYLKFEAIINSVIFECDPIQFPIEILT